MARKFVELHPEFPSVDVTNPDIEHFLLTFALYFFGSVLVMILGTIIYLPQYYAYSQVELLLCDTLAIGIAKPSRVLHTSRFLMKGYSSNALYLIYNYFLGISLSGLALELQVSLSSLISIAKSSSIKGCLRSSGEKFNVSD